MSIASGRLVREQNKKIEDPLECKKIGRYQIILLVAMSIVTIQYYWPLTNFDARMVCIDPPGVIDLCPPKCKAIKVSDPLIIEGYKAAFSWICDRKGRGNILHYAAVCGSIVGAIFWTPFVKKYGKICSIILGIGIQTLLDLLLICFPVEMILIWNSFTHYFTGVGCFFACKVLIYEVVPLSKFNTIYTVFLMVFALCQVLKTLCWMFLKHWYWCHVVKTGITAIVFCMSWTFSDTPRGYFYQNDTDKAIEKMEKISRTNEDIIHGIKENIEKAWRLSRTIPKSRDSIIGIFHYNISRYVFMQSCILLAFSAFCIFISGFINAISMTVTTNMFYRTFINYGFSVLGNICFFILTEWYRSKRLINYLFLANAASFLLWNLMPSNVLWCFASLARILSSITHSYIYLFLMTLFPISLRFEVFVACNIVFYIGFELGRVIIPLKTLWLPAGLACLFCLLSAMEEYDVSEMKTLPTFSTIRDLEEYLKNSRSAQTNKRKSRASRYNRKFGTFR